jgi:hypothetical protein
VTAPSAGAGRPDSEVAFREGTIRSRRYAVGRCEAGSAEPAGDPAPGKVPPGSETLVRKSEMPVTAGWFEARRWIPPAPAPRRAGYLPEP